MRFHFNIHNSVGFVPDEEGRELPDLDTARAEALKGARSLIADEVLQGRLDLSGRIDVVDTAGNPVLILPFREAVQIVPDAAVSPRRPAPKPNL